MQYSRYHGRNPRGGGQGDDPPKNFGWGDDIAHIPPPNKLSAQLRKITICLDNLDIILKADVLLSHLTLVTYIYYVLHGVYLPCDDSSQHYHN